MNRSDAAADSIELRRIRRPESCCPWKRRRCRRGDVAEAWTPKVSRIVELLADQF